jgi:ABC-2 type transport system ATP-binding protein
VGEKVEITSNPYLSLYNVEPVRLELYHPKLEDIFFNLTGRQLRDT